MKRISNLRHQGARYWPVHRFILNDRPIGPDNILAISVSARRKQQAYLK